MKKFLQNRINKKNRMKLTNKMPSLICSNCTGGILYHWLGLQFRSPFINLYMTSEDFITAMENLPEFLESEIKELKDSGYNYPVGVGAYNTKIHFMHYDTFEQAIKKWNERKERVNFNNIGIMLTNFGGGEQRMDLLQRFEALPYKHKVVFTRVPVEGVKSAFYIKGNRKKKNLYATQYITGKRYIDQFDYIGFINHLEDK